MATNVTIDDSAQNGIVVNVTGATTVVGLLPHAAEHELGGSDELHLDVTQIDNLNTVLDDKLDDSQAGAFGLSLLATTTSSAALDLLPHAARHAELGSDPITITLNQVTGLSAALDAKLDDSQASAFGLSLLAAANANAATALLPHSGRHEVGGSDELTLDIVQITGLQTALDAKLDDSQATFVGLDILGANSTTDVRELIAAGVPSTGLISGGALSINVDTTKFNIAAYTAAFADYTGPSVPLLDYVTNAGSTALSVTDIATQPVTYIGVEVDGTVVQRSSPFTNAQRRTIVPLGVLVHSNNATINAINDLLPPLNSPLEQTHDLMVAIGPMNLSGNSYTANGANLNLNKSSGQLFKFGSNFHVAADNPHVSNQASGTAITFRYRRQNSAESSDTTSVDPNNYDVSGTLTAVPSNKFTVQRINMFQSGLTRIQYGQTVYDTLSDAEAGSRTEAFTTEPNINDNGILRALLIIKQGTTNLQTTTSAKIIEVSKFGASVGNAGSAITSANIIAALGYTPENVASKATTFTTLNNTLYPSTQAVADFVPFRYNTDTFFKLIGGDLTGNARGDNAIDIQTTRGTATCVASGQDAIAIGTGDVTASAAFSTAVAAGATASGSSSIALGRISTASGAESTAVGYSATASNTQAIAYGTAATASGAQSLAIGLLATASGTRSKMIGDMGTISTGYVFESNVRSSGSGTSGARVRLHGNTNNVALSLPKNDTALTASGAALGEEADGSLAAGMWSVRLNAAGTSLVFSVNDGGVIKTGTVAVS